MIYFVQAQRSKLIKIGFTVASIPFEQGRLKDLQRCSPDILHCIGTAHGAKTEERFLHRIFAPSHSHGEWFFPSPDLLAYIRKQLKNAGMCPCARPLKHTQSKYCGIECKIRYMYKG